MSVPTEHHRTDAIRLAAWSDVPDGTPYGAAIGSLELVVVRRGDEPNVLYGRCLHRGALLADGHVSGEDLICGVHGWDYRIDSGVSAYNNDEALHRFDAFVRDGDLFVDAADVAAFLAAHPQPDTSGYQARFHSGSAPEEAELGAIRELAANGLDRVGHHGPLAAMGVPRDQLPSWDHIQILTAQIARPPLLDTEVVATATTIGPSAARPLRLEIPLFVSDMSFGALSQEAKTALARGAQLAGTGICSGEGGMLPEEHAENGRYLYELASARFGWSIDLVESVQAFHFKMGQGAKTGTGGHLPGDKVTEKIAAVRGLQPGTPAISPARFPDWGLDDLARVASEVRERSGGIPVGVKMSAQHIEDDIDAALTIGIDYIIIDGRGGATGAAPKIFRDNISVPTIPALARARRHLDALGRHDVSLIATGGLRTAADFVKAMALGADAIALANSAIQAVGCVAMRACHTNNCPVGIATQQEHLRARLPVDAGAERLCRFLTASTELMQVMARACGHRALADFAVDDLTTFDRAMSDLAGIAFGGVR